MDKDSIFVGDSFINALKNLKIKVGDKMSEEKMHDREPTSKPIGFMSTFRVGDPSKRTKITKASLLYSFMIIIVILITPLFLNISWKTCCVGIFGLVLFLLTLKIFRNNV
jgi:hypothetical protein